MWLFSKNLTLPSFYIFEFLLNTSNLFFEFLQNFMDKDRCEVLKVRALSALRMTCKFWQILGNYVEFNLWGNLVCSHSFM